MVVVNARLHIICGNCGDTDFELRIKPNFYDESDVDPEYGEQHGEMSRHSASVKCKSCSTIHSLEATIPLKKKD